MHRQPNYFRHFVGTTVALLPLPPPPVTVIRSRAIPLPVR